MALPRNEHLLFHVHDREIIRSYFAKRGTDNCDEVLMETKRFISMCALTYLLCATNLAYSQSIQFGGNIESVQQAGNSQYIVYFDVDSWVLTSAGRSVVRDAAIRARTIGVSKIFVVGHTDASGPSEYNLDLSRKRARAVLRALEGNGVQSNIIDVDWKGEFELANPTGPEDVDSRNRRVTIILQT
jgi:outer membrane protein OmpA-like peptidoglycan-associated protein